MTPEYRSVAGRIRREIAGLRPVAQRAETAAADAAKESDDRFIDAAALNMHAHYSGLERVFELIARSVDLSVPSGPQWHLDLLNHMAAEIADVRPSVISESLAARLSRYRGFRHVVRQVYTYNLDPEEVTRLVRDLGALQQDLEAELSAFADFREGRSDDD